MSPKRKVKWILTSGLGNQLYGYFAGQYVAQRLNLKVQYVHNPPSKKQEQFKSNIRSFVLANPVKRAKTHIFFPSILRRIFFGIKRRNDLVSRLHNFLIRNYSESAFEIEAEIKGIESALENHRNRVIHVEGYFQDFSFYMGLRNRVALELRNQSEWYLNLINRIRLIEPIVVHLRLGDYVNQSNIWGVLDTKYYEESLTRIRLDFPDNEIWVFSDNFRRAKKLLTGIKEFDFNFIDSSSDQDPAEVLSIMSKGVAHVVSNSTFSLWAAIISNESKLVVVPNPFFKNVVNQARQLPSSWVKVSASWADDVVINSLV